MYCSEWSDATSHWVEISPRFPCSVSIGVPTEVTHVEHHVTDVDTNEVEDEELEG